MPTVVDETLARYPVVWTAAGTGFGDVDGVRTAVGGHGRRGHAGSLSVEIDVLAGIFRFSLKRPFRRLVLRQLCVARNVVVRGAELELQSGEPLEVVADRQLLGHAHAAVQLHRLLPDEPAGLADDRLGGR